MAKKRYTADPIIRKLREAEILQGQGKTIAQAVKNLGVTEHTFTAGCMLCCATEAGK
jgi:hypothetical protein